MGLIENVIKRFNGLRAKGYESGSLGSFLGVDGGASSRDMQANRGWVYAAVHAISEAMANIDFVLYEKKSDGTMVELKEHELLDLLDGVNPTMTGYELKHRTGSHLELAGNAYWLLMNDKAQPVQSADEVPTAIYPLNPVKMKIERGAFPELVRVYKYTDKASVTAYQPFQILHLKYPNPSDDVLGLAPVEALRSWIETDQNAADFQRVFFQNGARVGGILKASKSLNRETIEILRAQWHEMTQGLRNAHKPIIMPDYLTYEDNSKSQQEMDFVNSLNELRDKILAGLRVPKTLLGNAEGSTNRATAETATYVFALYTIKPKMKLITAYLNEFLVPRFGDNLYLGFRDPVPENKDSEIAELTAAMGGQPILTIDEARARYLGLPPLQGGNVILAPAVQQPIASTDETAPAINNSHEARKKTVSNGKPFRTQSARNYEKRQAFAKTLANRALGAVMEALKTNTLDQLTNEQYQKLWEVKIARTAPYEKKLIELLRGVNAKAKKEVIKNLSAAVKAQRKDVAAADLIKDKGRYVKLVVNGAVPVQTALFVQEASEASAAIGIADVDLLTPEVRAAIGKTVELMANSFVDTTVDTLASKLTDAVAQGMGIADLTDVVDGLFEYRDMTGADTVARTETTRIGNSAKIAAWDNSGIVGSKQWYTAEDERVCPECNALDGTIVELSDNFFDDSFGDGQSPPLHPNCRCDVRPVDINS